MARHDLQKPYLCADFNGCFGDILCLSHSDTCMNQDGDEVVMEEGMVVTAYENDLNAAGEPDALIATGVVEPSPDELRCNGSLWCLRIDENGVRNESEISTAGASSTPAKISLA